MTWKPFAIAIACLTTLFVMAHNTHAQDKITGPWLWMIAPTEPGQGGAASIDIDSLAVASDGAITEADVAVNGANDGDRVGNFRWTLGKIAATGSDNINDCLKRIGMTAGNVDHHSAYALFTFESDTARNNVTMRVGSDDAIKVWINGEVVHNNPIDRGAWDFQDVFHVDLVAGDNLLMVKVSERTGGWSMFVGIDTFDGSDNEWDREPDIEPPVQLSEQRPMLRLIYFLPNDRQPLQDIDEQMDRSIKEVQQFYAQHMENHGFGRKTFQIETDRQGKTVVHHVNGRFNHNSYQNNWEGAWNEAMERFDRSNHILFTVLDVDLQDITPCGRGGGNGRTGSAFVTAREWCFNISIIAHELGHAFGLNHDYRATGNWMPALGIEDHMMTSFCAAAWLDTIPAFNTDGIPINQNTTLNMRPPSLASPPNVIRLRFEVSDPDGIQQVQLLTFEPWHPAVFPALWDYKELKGTPKSSVEFVTSKVKPKNNQVILHSVDGHGNMTWQQFPIDTTSILPRPKVVSIPDVHLAAAVRDEIGGSITTHKLLNLTSLNAQNRDITDLTGLEHAHNLTTLNLEGAYVDGEGWVNSNKISDYSPLIGLTQLTTLNLTFNALTDVSFLSGLTQLKNLHLGNNTLSDISALAGLTQLTGLTLWNNAITDLTPLASLTQLTSLELSGNPLSDVSSLAGLVQLRSLSLSGLSLSEVSALSDLRQLTSLSIYGTSVSDVSPLAGLTQLIYLHLWSNAISDIAALSGLTQLQGLNLRNNAILDVSPLVGLDLPGTQWDSTGLFLEGNPLSYGALHTHIPEMQAKGVEVKFDSRTPTTLVKMSGTAQKGTINTPLPLPFVVEVRDQHNRAFAGVPVTFNVTAGGGRLSTTSTTTDVTGRAEAHLTLGRTTGTTTVRTTAAHISQPVQFTATAVLLSSPVALPDPNLRAQILQTLGKPRDSTLTMSDMLKLTALNANSMNIRDLTGLQHAANLTTVSLDDNFLADVALLAGLPELKNLSLDNNNLSDVGPLALLTEVETLSLNSNRISNVAALSALTHLKMLSLNNNTVLDVEPLTSLAQLKTLQLRGNPLSYPSLHTHISAIQSGGTAVTYDPRIPTMLVKLSGTHGVAGESFWLIVEVRDENGFGFAGVPVAFTIAAGGGSLFASNVITDRSGRAQTPLTLGATPGKNTVRATAVDVPRPVSFSITAVDANSRVTVGDTNLRARIAETLGKARDVQLTATDMLALTRLEAPNANIRNLAGLEYAHNLTTLNLGGEYISGEGWVNNNAISDFSPLFDLTQLSVLNLSFSPLPGTSFLLSLTQVKNLHLGNNDLSDISALSKLTQLTSLILWNNAITDVAPLASLTQLTSLSLQGNVITDAAPLASLTQLTHLDLSYMSVSDVSSLAGLTQLRSLYLYNTSLSDVSTLSSLTQLIHLGITGTSVSDISPLAGLTQLAYLHLGNNVISDIATLSGLTQLISLYLGSNSITDVSALSSLTQLEVLDLNANRILDVSPLVGLDLPGTQWNGTGLYIERNPLNYASVHTHIPAMQARGVEVKFDNKAHSALVKISGDTQESEVLTTLVTPLVVEALDPHGTAITGLSVTFRVIEGGGSLSATAVTTDDRGRAHTRLSFGPDPGVNKIRVTAPQITYPVTFTAMATRAAQLAADVNGDGIVNIQDLVLVSASFGQTGESHADVNSDGAVNIQDLVLVASAFGAGTTAAPALHPSALAKLSRQDIQRWLDNAKHLESTDAAHLRGIAVLEQLLALLLPKETALLPNYPNPFNPETWIPYQLVQPTKVTLHIYSVNGALVRTLALGHQPAGMYRNKKRAAYWDGRNEQGERVASGLYFYRLTAGDFSATRKLLIRK